MKRARPGSLPCRAGGVRPRGLRSDGVVDDRPAVWRRQQGAGRDRLRPRDCPPAGVTGRRCGRPGPRPHCGVPAGHRHRRRAGHRAHPDKQDARPTYKEGLVLHPLCAFVHHGPTAPVRRRRSVLRPSDSGWNTATDHVEVLTAALAQIPGDQARQVGLGPHRRRRGLAQGHRVALPALPGVLGPVHPPGNTPRVGTLAVSHERHGVTNMFHLSERCSTPDSVMGQGHPSPSSPGDHQP